MINWLEFLLLYHRRRDAADADGHVGMRVYMTVSTTTARAVLPVTGFEAR